MIKNWVNSSNFNAMTQILKKFDHTFLPVFIFDNMFPENRSFVMSVTSCIKDSCSNISLSNLWRETKLFDLVHSNETVTLQETWYQIYTCENGWENFLENLRIVALKLLALTWFASPNQSIYFNIDVDIFKLTTMHSPLIEKSISNIIQQAA